MEEIGEYALTPGPSPRCRGENKSLTLVKNKRSRSLKGNIQREKFRCRSDEHYLFYLP